jgi:ADP-heptose:LPS heptosyltransferase
MPKITSLGEKLSDFADTAALIENLDLVIAVDSAVAHLAGALGKPVWIMLRHSGEWRWLLERGDSPWYPTVRLFRQENPGDWAGVVSDITRQLQALMVQRKDDNP